MPLSPPSVPTWPVGGAMTAAWINTNIRDAITFLANPPLGVFTSTSAQTLANNTWTSIAFNATTVDTYNGHSNSTNNTRYTAQVAGYYELSGGLAFVPNASGTRNAMWGVNGTRIQKTGGGNDIGSSANDNPATPNTHQVFLNVNDYVELFGLQLSGGNLNTQNTGDFGCMMCVRWVHA
ncbi:MAG TPA: hypothetical protein VFT53_07390 [Candidatus Saccharimonadales bacterium]|nr:hypothetical protein [Candidatus Saccharimonadales bacterium]